MIGSVAGNALFDMDLMSIEDGEVKYGDSLKHFLRSQSYAEQVNDWHRRQF